MIVFHHCLSSFIVFNILHTQLVHSITKCYDNFECDDSNFNSLSDDIIDCDGRFACDSVDNITATTGEVSCDGFFSCSDVRNMIGYKDVTCRGHSSCIFGTNIISETGRILCLANHAEKTKVLFMHMEI